MKDLTTSEIRKTSDAAAIYNSMGGNPETVFEAKRTMQALSCILNVSHHILERVREEVSGDKERA